MPAASPRPDAPKKSGPETIDELSAEEEAVGGDDGEGGGEDWKPAYDAKLAEWREEADAARDRATRLRKQIEDEHAAAAKEAADAEKAQTQNKRDGESRKERDARLAALLADDSPSPGPIHKRIPPASTAAATREAWEEVKPKDEASTGGSPSQWEEISAPHSSSGDISAPSSKDNSDAPPASTNPAVNALMTPAAPGTPSLTLAIFTAPGHLTFSRIVAALGINLVLPFVNGIMLGLGEITAREGVRSLRLWWKGERPLFGQYRNSSNSSSGGLKGVAHVGLSGTEGF